MRPSSIRRPFSISSLINRINIMLHLISNKWFFSLNLRSIIQIWLLNYLSWSSISTMWIAFLSHQRYFQLINIILLFSSDLHTLAFHQTQNNSTYTFNAFIQFIYFLLKSLNFIYQFHIHTLQIRFLSLIQFQCVFDLVGSLFKLLLHWQSELILHIFNLIH